MQDNGSPNNRDRQISQRTGAGVRRNSGVRTDADARKNNRNDCSGYADRPDRTRSVRGGAGRDGGHPDGKKARGGVNLQNSRNRGSAARSYTAGKPASRGNTSKYSESSDISRRQNPQKLPNEGAGRAGRAYPDKNRVSSRAHADNSYVRHPVMGDENRRAAHRDKKKRSVLYRRAAIILLFIFIAVFVTAAVVRSVGTLGDENNPSAVAAGASMPSGADGQTDTDGSAPTEERVTQAPTEGITSTDASSSGAGTYIRQPTQNVAYPERTANTVSLGSKVDCPSAVLVDTSTSSIIAERDSEARMYPASLTKVVTLITAYDLIDNPYTETFTMTYEILNPLASSGNSRAGFEVGETNSLLDYFYGLILPSGADAADGIAVYCCGSVDAFVDKMNEKAAQIGMKNSHFTNPIGVHDANHYSTARDMALALDYAYRVDILAQILSKYRYTTAATDIHPEGIYMESNLQQRMKGDESGTCEVLGGKTGYTSEAKNCVACYARSNTDGKNYVFVALGGAKMYDPIWDCINTLKEYAK